MTPEDEVFVDALDVPPEARATFLQRACAGDQALQVRVEALLLSYDAVDAILKPPPAAVARLPEEKVGDRIERYRLVEKLGEGGCGVVYLAAQEQPVRREVALKIIKLGMDTKAVIARFGAERQALAVMDHTCIAKVFDAGATETGRPFFVMELVRGIAITKYCDEHRLALPQRLELFVQVCAAVQHAHEKGIVHRDLKPSNVLVSLHDGRPTPKVIDFGIAKATQGRLTDQTLYTAFAQLIGTPAYMSPEQAAMAADIDARTDLYALGVLLYELLAGRPPFDPKALASGDVDEIRRQIRDVEPPRPSARFLALDAETQNDLAVRRGGSAGALAQRLRSDLDWIVMRCLEKDRTRRYESAQALADDVERHLRHQPIVARPPSMAYRTRKFVRRHRAAVATVAAVGITLALGAGASLWQAQRAERAERQIAQQPPKTAPDSKSIAVLPFENIGNDSANDFFAAGVHEDILTTLAHLHELRVVSPTSVMAYVHTTKRVGEVGRELDVAYVMTGSIRRNGNQVRISVRLLRASTEQQVWAETMDRNLNDIFAIQSELAEKIAHSLQAAISPQEVTLLEKKPTEISEAYDLYLKARVESREGKGHERIASLLQAAVALDPQFALAWADLAVEQAHLYGFGYDQSESRLAAAKAAMDNAVRLDPEHPKVIRALGEFYSRAYLDYEKALAQYEKLKRIQPNDPDVYEGMGYILRRQGKWSDALSNFKHALELDPGNLRAANSGVANTLWSGRRYDELAMLTHHLLVTHQKAPIMVRLVYIAAYVPFLESGSTQEMESYLARLPAGLGAVRERALWEETQGHFAEAIRLRATLKDGSAVEPSINVSWGAEIELALQSAVLLVAGGDRDAGRARVAKYPAIIRERLEREPTNSDLWQLLGQIEAVLGHPDEALASVRRAVELLPESRDVPRGFGNRSALAFVYAWTGDSDRAIAEYAQLLKVPSGLNVHLMAHASAYHPLQSDTRFIALLNDPANNKPLF